MKQIHHVSQADFLDLARAKMDELLRIVDDADVIVVRRMYDPRDIRALRDRSFEWGRTTEPSWHPCLDGCPDYHRLHDNYPKAHVKQKMHAFYRHGFYGENRSLMDSFKEVFQLKNLLAGVAPDSFIRNQPSEGPIARVLVHHYPVGGGYQTQHIDPVSPFARIQTIVMASDYGVDFREGGLYARPDEDEPIYLDQHAQVGDLVVLSPGIRHGVAPVDPHDAYAWEENRGRWMVMPIIINGDYDVPGNVKAREA